MTRTPLDSGTIIREAIAGALQDVGIDPPSADADLVASGLLDSLGIVALLVEIERRCHVEVAMHQLDLDSLRTVAGIETLVARALAKDAGAASGGPASEVVLVRPGRGRPIFLAHTSYAVAATTQPIVAALETPRPIYAFQARGLRGAAVLQRHVEEMAATYLAAMKTVQPHGPYALGGYSFGGLIAYEIARQLSEAGEQIELLALIDPESSPRALSPADQRRFRLARPLRTLVYVLRRPLERIPLYVREAASRVVPSMKTSVRIETAPEHIAQFVQVARQAELDYVPRPFHGEAVLFLARTRMPQKPNPERVWSHLVRGRMEIVRLGCDHLDVRDHLDVVGRSLSRALSDGTDSA